ncbi:MAG: hypothetical protein MUD11_02770 [Rhodobacteraceae bacterium]|jgi:hypothetical protein|nr:hypothetical protein [Paracoccaceae bacterium]
MIISHFELLFKNQAPADTTTGVQPDVAVQGYFLEITNLDTKPIQFLAEFVIAPPGEANRSLAGNTLCFVDEPPLPGIAGAVTDNRGGVLQETATAGVFVPQFGRGLRNNFRLPAGGTGLLAVLPSIFPSPLDPSPLNQTNFEVRGHVRLRVPALRGAFPSIPIGQSSAPVPVLLTPQNRTSFVRAGVIEDQTQASLPLAMGVAQVSIPAEPGFLLPPIDFAFDRNRLQRVLDDLPIEPVARAEMLAGLLAQIGTDKDAISLLNKAMAAADIGVAIERRKVPA